MAWKIQFQEGFVENLPITKSDHSPLLLRFASTNWQNVREGVFHFQIAWLLDKRFSSFFQSNWNADNDFSNELQNMQVKLRAWNKSVFGSIFAHKIRVLHRLAGIQRLLPRDNNPHLKVLNKQLQKEYEGIVLQEECYWKQRLRYNRIALGDHNTSYFHASTVINKGRCRIP